MPLMIINRIKLIINWIDDHLTNIDEQDIDLAWKQYRYYFQQEHMNQDIINQHQQWTSRY